MNAKTVYYVAMKRNSTLSKCTAMQWSRRKDKQVRIKHKHIRMSTVFTCVDVLREAQLSRVCCLLCFRSFRSPTTWLKVEQEGSLRTKPWAGAQLKCQTSSGSVWFELEIERQLMFGAKLEQEHRFFLAKVAETRACEQSRTFGFPTLRLTLLVQPNTPESIMWSCKILLLKTCCGAVAVPCLRVLSNFFWRCSQDVSRTVMIIIHI